MNEGHGKGRVVIPAGIYPWPHELKVAQALAAAGHVVEFLPIASVKTADVLVDGIEYEIKSPFTNKPDKLERVVKRALKQCRNVVYDSSRIKGMRDENVRRFLVNLARRQSQIGKMLLVTKRGDVIDIK